MTTTIESGEQIGGQAPGRGKIRFRNGYVFFGGVALVAIGVLLHLKEYIDAKSAHYVLANMPMSTSMWIGMGLILIGYVLSAYGVGPPPRRTDVAGAARGNFTVETLDDVPFNAIHWSLIFVLSIVLIIDVMKPASLGFAVPGMAKEYGLSKASVALLPFLALLGTTIGSFMWGWFGDLIGRRASILYAAVLFVGTSICGAMPSFGWNLVMCFLMGVAAGGLLPTAIALITELLPVGYRASLVVVLGGIGAVGGYLAASSAATFLEPSYGWRILWLLNLPTGLMVIVLNFFIPESPRFLLSQGRWIEASRILQVFSVGSIHPTAETEPAPPVAAPASLDAESGHHYSGMGKLFRPPYVVQTLTVALYGFAWGLVNYGFFLWLPTNLRASGFSIEASNAILAKSAVIAFPAVLLVAALYGRWSSKWSMILVGGLTAAALLAFLPLAGAAQQNGIALTLLIILALAASAGMTATLSPYGAEVYPTSVRARGSGIAAGAGKFGGLLGIAAVLAHVTPTIHTSALIVAIPVIAATLLLTAKGLETRGRRLEDVSGEAGPPKPLVI